MIQLKIFAIMVCLCIIAIQNGRTLVNWWFRDIRKWTKLYYADGVHCGWSGRGASRMYYFPEDR